PDPHRPATTGPAPQRPPTTAPGRRRRGRRAGPPWAAPAAVLAAAPCRTARCRPRGRADRPPATPRTATGSPTRPVAPPPRPLRKSPGPARRPHPHPLPWEEHATPRTVPPDSSRSRGTEHPRRDGAPPRSLLFGERAQNRHQLG